MVIVDEAKLLNYHQFQEMVEGAVIVVRLDDFSLTYFIPKYGGKFIKREATLNIC